MPSAEDATRSGRPRATTVLVAELEPRPGGRLLRAARVTGAVVSQLALQLIPSPSLHDVVVRRRADGQEVLRLDSSDPFHAGDTLGYVRGQLETLDEESFLTEWEPRARS